MKSPIPVLIVFIVALVSTFLFGLSAGRRIAEPVIKFEESKMNRVGELGNSCILYQLSFPGQDEPTARVLAIWCPTPKLPFSLDDIRP